MSGLLWIAAAALLVLWIIGLVAKWTLGLIWTLFVIAVIAAVVASVINYFSTRRGAPST
jgi:FtsH-binding integral membrane protein